LAVDRQTLIDVVQNGHAVPTYGPLSPAVRGYWPGAEYVGYHYDLDRAKELMQEAGYTYSADGMLEKNGEPFKVVMKVPVTSIKDGEVLQRKFTDLGVDLELEQQDFGTMVTDLNQGNFELAVNGFTWPDSGLLFGMFHTNMIGVFNQGWVSDPVLDEMLVAMRYGADAEASEALAYDVQKYIIEQAYIVPLYTPKNYSVLSNRVKDANYSPHNFLTLFDAYIEETE
jgi:peptide/nickel transport system substrate-binding protein